MLSISTCASTPWRKNNVEQERLLENGRAAQVDPMKPMLKALKSKRLKLNNAETLIIVPFKFNVRRYGTARRDRRNPGSVPSGGGV